LGWVTPRGPFQPRPFCGSVQQQSGQIQLRSDAKGKAPGSAGAGGRGAVPTGRAGGRLEGAERLRPWRCLTGQIGAQIGAGVRTER